MRASERMRTNSRPGTLLPPGVRRYPVQRGRADCDEDDPGHGQCRHPERGIPAEPSADHQAQERQHAYGQEKGKPGECGKCDRDSQREKGAGKLARLA